MQVPRIAALSVHQKKTQSIYLETRQLARSGPAARYRRIKIFKNKAYKNRAFDKLRVLLLRHPFQLDIHYNTLEPRYNEVISGSKKLSFYPVFV